MLLEIFVGGGLVSAAAVLFDCWRHRVDCAARLHAVTLSSIADAVIATDLGGVVTFMNPEAERLTAWPRDEAIGCALDEIFRVATQETGERAENPVAVVLRTGRALALANHTRLMTRDGRSIPIENKASPIRHADGTMDGVVLIFRDCTEQHRVEEEHRKLEAELRQAQKMESVGLLAGGVAHDFNNALTIIMGSTEVLAEEVRDHPDTDAVLEEIRRATDRAASLTRQLLAFSRKDVVAPRVIDFNALVSETERMLRRLLGEDIELVSSLDKTIAHVRVDPGQWDQVLVNLAVNARDAMTGCGRLTIATRDVVIDEASTRRVPPGRYVELSISDTGSGMPLEVTSRIFEPFFTTKGVGHGTGLGLAVVDSIVKQNGSHIEVRSEVNAGTTFTILIPTIDAAIDSTQDEQRICRFPKSNGAETILLVEDESSLRRMAARVLAKHGYKVLQAASGPEALRLIDTHDGRVDLVVTDVVMPIMDGRELAEKLRERRPSLGVLFTSGYTEDAVVHRGVETARVEFLQKPYAPQTLAQKVRDVLERQGAMP